MVVADIFGRDGLVLQRTTTANDVPGWDSFKQIEIALAIEEQLGVRLGTRDMGKLKNVGELTRLVASKLLKGSGR